MSKEYIEKEAFRQELIDTPFYPRCRTTPDLLTSVQDRLNDTIELLDNFPPADVKSVVKGEWIREETVESGEIWVKWRCDECGYVRTQGWKHTKDGEKPTAKLCENCGADMRKEANDE